MPMERLDAAGFSCLCDPCKDQVLFTIPLPRKGLEPLALERAWLSTCQDSFQLPESSLLQVFVSSSMLDISRKFLYHRFRLSVYL